MENAQERTVKSWYARGWRTYRRHTKPLILGSALLVGLSLIFTLLNTLVGGYWVIVITQLFILPLLSIGWLFLCLKAIRDGEVRIALIVSPFSKYGRTWVTYILYLLIVVAGIFTGSLFPKLVTDWLGAQAFVERMEVKFDSPAYLNDTVTYRGKVGKKTAEEGVKSLAVSLAGYESVARNAPVAMGDILPAEVVRRGRCRLEAAARTRDARVPSAESRGVGHVE